MKSEIYTKAMPKHRGGRVVALGFFDGVHPAHRALIEAARHLADKEGLELAVFTFLSEGSIKKNNPRLYTTESRLAFFEELGVSTVILADFLTVAHYTKEEFVEEVLIDTLDARIAVCGYNFRFAKGASASADDLSELMEKHGGRVHILPPYLYGDTPLSTTRIRELLQNGEIEEANRMLGAPYFLSGRVEHGEGLGHVLGFPTMNLSHPEDTTPLKHGVYRSVTEIDGVRYHSVTNVGVCPTVGERPAHSETHVIGEKIDAYGKSVRVYLLGFLREEKRFPSQNELIMQINIDKNEAICKNGALETALLVSNEVSK